MASQRKGLASRRMTQNHCCNHAGLVPTPSQAPEYMLIPNLGEDTKRMLIRQVSKLVWALSHLISADWTCHHAHLLRPQACRDQIFRSLVLPMAGRGGVGGWGALPWGSVGSPGCRLAQGGSHRGMFPLQGAHGGCCPPDCLADPSQQLSLRIGAVPEEHAIWLQVCLGSYRLTCWSCVE